MHRWGKWLSPDRLHHHAATPQGNILVVQDNPPPPRCLQVKVADKAQDLGGPRAVYIVKGSPVADGTSQVRQALPLAMGSPTPPPCLHRAWIPGPREATTGACEREVCGGEGGHMRTETALSMAPEEAHP